MDQDIGESQQRWLDRVQSQLVLPTARTLYLVGCGLCVAIAVIAIAVAGFFQLQAWSTVRQEPVPLASAAEPSPVPLDVVDRRLTPPSKIRFVQVENEPAEITSDSVVGRLEADSGNEGVRFQFIGGRDASLFVEENSGRAGLLRPIPALAAELNTPAVRQGTISREFEIRVVARDQYDNVSPVTDVRFTLAFASPAVAAAAEAPTAPTGPDVAADLKEIARAIARIVDPTRSTPEFFDAYHEALGEPARCGANGESRFTDAYGEALKHERPKLRASNLPAFYSGLCQAWSQSQLQGAQAAQQAAVRRMQVIAENAARHAEAAAKRIVSESLRNVALLFVAGAVFAFMVIALFLAFLAIEGHSNSVRQVLELLAKQAGAAPISPSASRGNTE